MDSSCPIGWTMGWEETSELPPPVATALRAAMTGSFAVRFQTKHRKVGRLWKTHKITIEQ